MQSPVVGHRFVVYLGPKAQKLWTPPYAATPVVFEEGPHSKDEGTTLYRRKYALVPDRHAQSLTSRHPDTFRMAELLPTRTAADVRAEIEAEDEAAWEARMAPKRASVASLNAQLSELNKQAQAILKAREDVEIEIGVLLLEIPASLKSDHFPTSEPISEPHPPKRRKIASDGEVG